MSGAVNRPPKNKPLTPTEARDLIKKWDAESTLLAINLVAHSVVTVLVGEVDELEAHNLALAVPPAEVTEPAPPGLMTIHLCEAQFLTGNARKPTCKSTRFPVTCFTSSCRKTPRLNFAPSLRPHLADEYAETGNMVGMPSEKNTYR